MTKPLARSLLILFLNVPTNLLHLTRYPRIHTMQDQRPRKKPTNASAVLSFILLCLLVQCVRRGTTKTGMYGEPTALKSIIPFFQRIYQSRQRFQFGPIGTTQTSIHSIFRMLKVKQVKNFLILRLCQSPLVQQVDPQHLLQLLRRRVRVRQSQRVRL